MSFGIKLQSTVAGRKPFYDTTSDVGRFGQVIDYFLMLPNTTVRKYYTDVNTSELYFMMLTGEPASQYEALPVVTLGPGYVDFDFTNPETSPRAYITVFL